MFLSPTTIASVLSVAAELGVITAGVALLMISGEFNLAVSSIYALCPVLVIILSNSGLEPTQALILSLLTMAGIGSVIGLVTVLSGVHSFIVSLAFMFILRCLVLYVTGGVVQVYKANPYLLFILNGNLGGGFRTAILWFIGIVIVLEVLLRRTRYGNWCYAAGGNPYVSRALGVRVRFVKIMNFAISSVTAGLAGCFSLGRLGVFDPSVGYGLELESIAASVVGGCSLFGGFGSISGAFFGAVTLSTFRIGLVLAGAPLYWYKAFVGIVLVIAAIIDYFVMRKVLLYR